MNPLQKMSPEQLMLLIDNCEFDFDIRIEACKECFTRTGRWERIEIFGE